MTEPQKMPDLLVDMAARVQKILMEKAGIEKALAEHIGFEISREMAEAWGGHQVYMPKGLDMLLHSRDLQIWEDFNGRNHAVLSKKYGISMVWVYAIVKRMRALDLARRQPGLFDEIRD
jgi:Mor family transcriptional regulator